MFVQENSLKEVKSYFSSKLANKFSRTEIKLIVKLIVIKRLSINSLSYFNAVDIRFSESDLLYFRNVANRLLDNEPFQYVLGEVEFYNLELNIDERALIPRPETEELVDWLIESVKKNDTPRILDLCAGSGCIALALKSTIKDAEIVAVELSQSALDLIEDNCEKTELVVDFQKMDVLDKEGYSLFEEASFDIWVSNPPYIPEVDKAMMHENVLDYEPHMALFVDDEDPLLFYRIIAEQAQTYLKPGGWLYFEIHEGLAEKMHGMLHDLQFVNIELRKDLQEKDRMMRAQLVISQHES